MVVHRAIWESVAGDVENSLYEVANAAPLDGRFINDLHTYMGYCKEMATLGTVQHCLEIFEGEEAESMLQAAHDKLQVSIVSHHDDTGTVPVEQHPGTLLARLTESVNHCIAAESSWVRDKALKALNEKVEDHRTQENWASLGRARDVENFRNHAQQYTSSIAQICGPPVTLVLED